MYVIGKIIYGSPVGDAAREWLAENNLDEESAGLEEAYSGSSNVTPAWVGVVLGEIDEATDAVGIDTVNGRLFYGPTIDKAEPFSIVPTSEQINEARSKFGALSEGLRKVMPPIGIYLVWATS